MATEGRTGVLDMLVAARLSKCCAAHRARCWPSRPNPRANPEVSHDAID